jgi:hypothetical protein
MSRLPLEPLKMRETARTIGRNSTEALYFRRLRSAEYKKNKGRIRWQGVMLPRGVRPGTEAAIVYLEGRY